jgi:hypothetical protein
MSFSRRHQAAEQPFVSTPLVDVDLGDLLRTKTVLRNPAEALRYRTQPLASEEFDIPPSAPRVFVVGRTSDGSYLMTVENTAEYRREAAASIRRAFATANSGRTSDSAAAASSSVVSSSSFASEQTVSPRK